MQLILGQPRTASHGLGLSVAWIGPPSVDGGINCIEQSHFLPLLLIRPLFLVACQRSLEREMMAVEAI